MDVWQLGERLRALRRGLRLSLHDVQRRSHDEFKASVLGAYERGQRVISVPRLLRLAEIYGVKPEELLPRATDVALTSRHDTRAAPRGEVTIDLVRLHELDDAASTVVARYAQTVQRERGRQGDILTLRRRDLSVLAAVVGCSVDALGAHLARLDDVQASQGVV
jgi:transcriptional regulator with XRE-family HTH domain